MLKTLKPFQIAGSLFLQNHPHALLADEPGLGKTLQAIDAANHLPIDKILVICPASVRTNWHQELYECGTRGIWDIISYDQAVAGNMAFDRYDALILDEGHFLKTPESQRTQAVFGNGDKGIARRVSGPKWILTGTPVLNRPRELYPMLKCLHPDFARDSFNSYAQRYCGAYFDGRGTNTKGASRLDELKQRLNGFMLRRTKEEVLPQLPPKIITRAPILLDRSSLEMIENVENEVLDREAKISSAAEDFSQLGDLARLLHVIGMAKIAPAAEFIEDLLETQEKIVVFTRHREVLAGLAARLVKFAPVQFQGGMPDGQKQRAIDIFKTDDGCRVFLANIAAGGTGINGLQEVASSVVFAELSWIPGEMSQAIDRLNRIGQEASVVNAYLLHVPGTMESAILNVQNAKGSVIGRLMGEAGWKTG